MTVTTTFPGVYITEIPSGSRTIVGVATSITAFVGAASRGPVNEPVPIASFADFERTFGGLIRSSGLGYAVRDFYLNGGGEALVVRLVHTAPPDPDDPDADPAAGPGHRCHGDSDIEGLGLEASGPGDLGERPAGRGQPTRWTTDAIRTSPPARVSRSTTCSRSIDPEVQEADGGPAETFLNVTVVEGPRRVDVVLGASQLVRVSGGRPLPGVGPNAVRHLHRGHRRRRVADGAALDLLDYEGSAEPRRASTRCSRPTCSTSSASRRRRRTPTSRRRCGPRPLRSAPSSGRS